MVGGWDRDRQSAEAATQIGQRDIFGLEIGRRRAENYWGENESRELKGEEVEQRKGRGGERIPTGVNLRTETERGDVSGN